MNKCAPLMEFLIKCIRTVLFYGMVVERFINEYPKKTRPIATHMFMAHMYRVSKIHGVK